MKLECQLACCADTVVYLHKATIIYHLNSLPQRLIDPISRYLETNNLKEILFLNTKSQPAAERYSDAYFTYTLTEDNVGDVLDFCGVRLAQHLQNIRCRTNLPALDLDVFNNNVNAFENNSCRDTVDELREIDEHFTRQINLLFTALHKIAQVTTLDGHRGLELEIYTPTRAVYETKFCLDHTITSWRSHIIAPETLPRVKRTRSLRIQNGPRLEYADIPNPPFRELVSACSSISLPSCRISRS